MFVLLSLLAILIICGSIFFNRNCVVSNFFCFFWALQVLFICSIGSLFFELSGVGLFFILISCFLFSFFNIAGKLFLEKKLRNRDVIYQFNYSHALMSYKLVLILAFIFPIYSLYLNGYNLFKITSFLDLIAINHTLSVARYDQTLESNGFSSFILIFVYLSPLIGGYLFSTSYRKKGLLYLSLAPSALILLTQAVKTAFIASSILFAVGLLTSRYFFDLGKIKLNVKKIIKQCVILFAFLSVLYVSMIFRVGSFSNELIKVTNVKLINYTIGHLPSFDLWMDDYLERDERMSGVKTFYGLTKYFKNVDRQQGIFTLGDSYGKDGQHYFKTNVFTTFRFLIEDFGVFGAIFFISIQGFFSGIAIALIRKKQFPIISQIVYSSIFFFLANSYLASTWAYTSYIVVFVFFYFFLQTSLSRKKVLINE